MTEVTHDSDCAMHNEPAYPNGPCDCSALTPRHEAPAPPSDAIEHPLYTVSEAARRQLVKAAGWIERQAYDTSGNDDPEDEGLDEAAAWLRSTFDLSDTALGIVRNASDEIVSIGHEAPADGAGETENPGGYLIKDFADGWFWTPHRIAATAALTDGHAVYDLRARSSAPEAREGEAKP